MGSMKKEFDGIRGALNANFCERQAVIDGLMTAAIAGHHVLLLGPPGTAKTRLTRTFAGALFGEDPSTFFGIQLSKFTRPDDLFGPVDVDAYANKSTFRRIWDGYAWAARCVFLDEVWKGSEAILQTMLDMLEDRVARDGGCTQKIPLEIAVGASNEYPGSDALNALYDRFSLRYWVEPIGSRAELATLMSRRAVMGPVPTLSPETLADARALAKSVPMDGAVDVVLDIKERLQAAGMVRSDRTWVAQVPALLAARAVLNGRTKIAPDDFHVLADVLWDRHDERAKVLDIVGKVADPHGAKATVILDAITVAMRGAPTLSQLESGQLKKAEALAQIAAARGKVVAEIDRLRDIQDDEEGRENIRVQQAVSAGEAACTEIDTLTLAVTRYRPTKG